MKIQIISVGKLSSEISLICAKYIKMIGWGLIQTELAHSKKSATHEIKVAEAIFIQSKLRPKAVVVSLDLSGKQLCSNKFSKFIEKQMMDSKDIDFIIGGAYGIDESILNISNLKLSLSLLTFPHQLAKLLLLEQIYRAQTIIENHPYHK